MEIDTHRGFHILVHDQYPPGVPKRLIQESSAVGDYEDSFEKPGSSYLWVGEDHHLNREQVGELISYMQRWLDTGSLNESSMKEDDA